MRNQTLVATALLAIVALSTAASPVYAENVPGWSATLFPPTVFVGDALNVTIKGPEANQVLKTTLTAPNGTLLETRFIRMLNGTAFYKHQFSLDAIPGNYTVRAGINDTLVLTVDFRLIFDEQNYQAKRTAILEKQVQELQKGLALSRQSIRELKAQVDGFWWLVYLGWFLLGTAVATWFFNKITVSFLASWKYPYESHLKGVPRLLRASLAPRGAGDLRSFDYTRNFRNNPVESDMVVRSLFRQAGRPEPPLPARHPWTEEAKLKPFNPPPQPTVRKIKFRVPKRGSTAQVARAEGTLAEWQGSLEQAKQRYKDSPEVLEVVMAAHEAEIAKTRAELVENLKARAEKSSAPSQAPEPAEQNKES